MSYIYNLLKQFLAFLLNTTDKYVGNFWNFNNNSYNLNQNIIITFNIKAR